MSRYKFSDGSTYIEPDNSFTPGSTMPRTLEDLKVGDVLDCGSCSQRTVLAVCGKVCCLSTGNDKEEVGGWYTVDNLIDAGIRLHQEPEPKRITISREAYDELCHELCNRVASRDGFIYSVMMAKLNSMVE